jgi:predicted HTH transcriptional regulator
MAEPYMIKELQLEGTNRSFDSVQVVGEISEKEIKQLCNRLYKHAIERCKSAEQRAAQKEVSINQLITWKIIVRINEKFYPTNAWKLLTGDTEELFPNAFIQMAAFKGITRSVFLDKQEARGPIDQQIEDAMMFVKRHINLGSRINGKYTEDYYEFPIDSIREIISNAVCHRSYLSPGSIQVAIYDDRLEVTSPGRLSPDLTIEQIKEGNSRIRNSAIGAAFFYMHIIENWGSGIPRVFSEARLYGLDEPEIKDFGTSFRITIKRKKFETDPLGVVVPYAEGIVQPQSSASNDAEGIVQPQSSASNDAEEKSSDLKVQELITKFTSNLNDKNVERTILILTEIHSNLKISVEQIGKNIRVSRATVQRAINEMKKLGILSRKGSNNGGSWIIHFDK